MSRCSIAAASCGPPRSRGAAGPQRPLRTRPIRGQNAGAQQTVRVAGNCANVSHSTCAKRKVASPITDGRMRMKTNAGIPVRSRSPADWLLETKRYERAGELLQAYDIARQGLAKYPGDLALKHRAVLCLASTQAISQAAELFSKLELDLSDSELAVLTPGLRMDIPSLNARLRKDEALASSGQKRSAKLREAADLYESCFRREATANDPEAYYPATNAATLRLLAGDREPAAELARKTVAWLEARPDRQGYYELVSAVEAHLVLGNLGRASELMRLARAQIQGTAAADYR